MKLLLDIGNSRIKWCQINAGGPVAYGATARRDDDWTQALPALKPDEIWVANVAGEQVLSQLRQWADDRWQLAVKVTVSSAKACGVRCAYAVPERLGVDRWAACIAGYHRGAGSVLVADAGTALTLDFIAANGHHRGGLICPGVATMRRALLGGTQLFADNLDHALSWLAVDTDPAVALGSLQAALALLENAVRELQPERCLITGGEAELLGLHLDKRWKHAPHLVLEGVAQIALERANAE